MSESFPHFIQTEIKDCGPACIKAISKYMGIDVDIEEIKEACQLSDRGTSLYNMEAASKKIGIDCIATKIDFDRLITEVELPCIVLMYGNHYVIIPPQEFNNDSIIISDPNIAEISCMSVGNFLRHWLSSEMKGYAILYGNK